MDPVLHQSPDLAPGAVARMQRQGRPLVLVDVREPHEVAHGRIPGAQNVPLGQLPGVAHRLPRDVPVVLYCQSGHRSGQAARYLRGLGFRNARSLAGGYPRWVATTRPAARSLF